MAIFNLAELRSRLEEMGISPKKSLGQNFLINTEAIEKIIVSVRSLKPAHWIEIGPGLGALTESLLKFGQPLFLMELDHKLSDYWRTRLGAELILEGDALQVDWQSLEIPSGTVLVSNLPYQIAASLVVDRSVGPVEISGMVLMFQKEVAQRITAKTNSDDYGFLTVMAQTFWDVRTVLEVSSKDFFPPPAVASRVVEFRRRAPASGLDPEQFLKVVKAGFSQRRKLLIRNLEQVASRDRLNEVFSKLGLDHQVRAENLTPQNFQDLVLALN